MCSHQIKATWVDNTWTIQQEKACFLGKPFFLGVNRRKYTLLRIYAPYLSQAGRFHELGEGRNIYQYHGVFSHTIRVNRQANNSCYAIISPLHFCNKTCRVIIIISEQKNNFNTKLKLKSIIT